MRFLLLFLFIFISLNAFEMVLIEPNDEALADFYVGTTPVTQALYFEIMQSNPSFFKGDSLPVERITWYQALSFCNKLSVAHGLVPVYGIDYNPYEITMRTPPNHRLLTWTRATANPKANGYRLLTHKEWEYIYLTIKDEVSENIEDYAWIYTNSDNKTHPVGSKIPDSLGLYDFLGNVMEWRYDFTGFIPNKYYLYDTLEEEIFYSHIAFQKFKRGDFQVTKDRRGLYSLVKSPLLGMRVARNKR